MYKKLGALRTEQKDVFAEGTYRNITTEKGVFAFARESASGEIIVIANCGEQPYAFVEKGGKWVDLLTDLPFGGRVPPCSVAVLARGIKQKTQKEKAPIKKEIEPRRLYKERYE